MLKLWIDTWILLTLRSACTIDQLCFSGTFHNWMCKYLPGELVFSLQASVSVNWKLFPECQESAADKQFPCVCVSRAGRGALTSCVLMAPVLGRERGTACRMWVCATISGELPASKMQLQHLTHRSERWWVHSRAEPWLAKACYKTRRGRNSKIS